MCNYDVARSVACLTDTKHKFFLKKKINIIFFAMSVVCLTSTEHQKFKKQRKKTVSKDLHGLSRS